MIFPKWCDMPPLLAAILALVCCFAHLVSCSGTRFPFATGVAGFERAPIGSGAMLFQSTLLSGRGLALSAASVVWRQFRPCVYARSCRYQISSSMCADRGAADFIVA